jgi:hypothetical protein
VIESILTGFFFLHNYTISTGCTAYYLMAKKQEKEKEKEKERYDTML